MDHTKVAISPFFHKSNILLLGGRISKFGKLDAYMIAKRPR
jgi:hypothetical protein